MTDDHLDLLAFRRSRLRCAVLLALDLVGTAHAAHLAELSGISIGRVRWVMRGKLPYFRPELSLVARGLAREARTSAGVAYVITPPGRRRARLIRELRRLNEREAARRVAMMRRL